MDAIKAGKKNAERVRRFLKAHKLMAKNYDVYRKGNFIYFPVSNVKGREISAIRGMGGVRASAGFKRLERSAYRELLLERLGRRRYDNATKSYDILGNIAVIDADSGALARRIAGAVMETNSSVETVIRKIGAVKGRYRRRRYGHVAGRRNYIATYRENGALMRFDVRKSFFSPRLSYERSRIAALAKEGEQVIVMFAGVGPFALVLAKAHPHSKIVAIELNRYAYNEMLSNIRLNKARNVIPVLGDVNRQAAMYRHFADRIIMPLPKDSHSFLGAALTAARKGCIVHYYAFEEAEGAYEKQISVLRSFFDSKKRKIRILNMRIVRPYSAHEVEIVLDFRIL